MELKVVVMVLMVWICGVFCDDGRDKNEIHVQKDPVGVPDQWMKCREKDYIIKAFQIQYWKRGIIGLKFFCFDTKNQHKDTLEMNNVEAPIGQKSFDRPWRKIVYWLEQGNCKGVEGYFVKYTLAVDKGILQNFKFECLSGGQYGEVSDMKKPDELPEVFSEWSTECRMGTAISGVRVRQEEGNMYFSDIEFLCWG